MSDLIELTQTMIDDIFMAEYKAESPHQSNILIALYKVAFPNWDNIRKLNSWPKISENTSKYIYKKFRDFDDKFHPNVLKGGLWFDSGFSSDKNLDDWKIYPIDSDKIFYKGKINRIKKVYISEWLSDDTWYGRIQFVRQFQLNNDRHESFWYHHLSKSSQDRINRLKLAAQNTNIKNDIKEYTFTWKG